MREIKREHFYAPFLFYDQAVLHFEGSKIFFAKDKALRFLNRLKIDKSERRHWLYS